MAEILYFCNSIKNIDNPMLSIRWLPVEDYDVFCEHLKLCGQQICTQPQWEKAYRDGTIYCGLFLGNKMVSRACVEKYSVNAWEVADVRTVREHRNKGYAKHICCFAMDYIISCGKTATIRTEEDNISMRTVIKNLGFLML